MVKERDLIEYDYRDLFSTEEPYGHLLIFDLSSLRSKRVKETRSSCCCHLERDLPDGVRLLRAASRDEHCASLLIFQIRWGGLIFDGKT